MQLVLFIYVYKETLTCESPFSFHPGVKTIHSCILEVMDFWSRWQRRQTWLTSSHNHIKITTKIWNNYHSEPSEIVLNGSLTTTKFKKQHPSRLVGGVQRWNRLVPHPCVVDKNSGGISRE